MRNSFTVQLAVKLFMTALGWPPAVSLFAGPVLAWFLGAFADYGILKIDLTLDALKRGMEVENFEKLAKAAHDKATARIYSEAEKNEIRQQYLDALRDFAKFGNGMRKR